MSLLECGARIVDHGPEWLAPGGRGVTGHLQVEPTTGARSQSSKRERALCWPGAVNGRRDRFQRRAQASRARTPQDARNFRSGGGHVGAQRRGGICFHGTVAGIPEGRRMEFIQSD